MRVPRLTCVSDGNPRRRLLVRSKKGAVVMCVLVCHTASLVHYAYQTTTRGGSPECTLHLTRTRSATPFESEADLE
jgi:hypothetical protein